MSVREGMRIGQISLSAFSVLSAAAIAMAATGGHEVSSYNIDAGEVSGSTGNGYELSGTLGRMPSVKCILNPPSAICDDRSGGAL